MTGAQPGLMDLIKEFEQRESFWHDPDSGMLARARRAREMHEEAIRKIQAELDAAEARARPVLEAETIVPETMNTLDDLDDELRRKHRVLRNVTGEERLPVRLEASDLEGLDPIVQKYAEKANTLLASGNIYDAKKALSLSVRDWFALDNTWEDPKRTRIKKQLKELRRVIERKTNVEGNAKAEAREVETRMGKTIHAALQNPKMLRFLENDRVKSELGSDPSFQFLQGCMQRGKSAAQIADNLRDLARSDPNFSLEFHKLNVLADQIFTTNSGPIVAAREMRKKAQERLETAKDLEFTVREIASEETTSRHYSDRTDRSIARGLAAEQNDGSPALNRHTKEFQGRRSRWVNNATVERYVATVEQEDFDPKQISVTELERLKSLDWQDGVDYASAAAGEGWEKAKKGFSSAFNRARNWMNKEPGNPENTRENGRDVFDLDSYEEETQGSNSQKRLPGQNKQTPLLPPPDKVLTR